ncbi:MAG: hypothetical protein EA380_00880 [Phycisphaeraceae bacterium]|nr:MAG: hypothetical protein EA380_00880 [Phycisphaeraceae bacterium]
MGRTGQIGPVGPTGIIERWTFYREFWFDQDQGTIHNADRYQLEQIASYMRNNPSLELGLDGSAVSGSAAGRNRDLADSRVRAVRNGLINAGVPADRIGNALIANPDHRREGRVAVLLRTTPGYVGTSTAYDDSRSGAEFGRGTVDDWTTYHTFSFDADQTNIHSADRERITEIVSFMQRNPNMVLGISSSQQAADRALATRRSNVLRDTLIDEGVERSRIRIGEFGDGRISRSGRLEVLVMTDRAASQQR